MSAIVCYNVGDYDAMKRLEIRCALWQLWLDQMPIGPERQLSTALCGRCFTSDQTYSHQNRLLCWKCIVRTESMGKPQ